MSETFGIAAYAGKRRKPLEAVRAFCVACQGGAYEAVETCAAASCPLHPMREGRRPEGASAIQAARAYCAGECLPGQPEEVRTCQAFAACGDNPPCPLWPYRFGNNPYYSEKAREEARGRALGRQGLLTGEGAENAASDAESGR